MDDGKLGTRIASNRLRSVKRRVGWSAEIWVKNLRARESRSGESQSTKQLSFKKETL